MLAGFSFPHMSRNESLIWDRFLHSGHLPSGVIYYDARVGHPIPQTLDMSDWVSGVVNATSRKRLDVVIRNPRAWYIYEVKVRAGLSAVGQGLGYEYLFSESIAGDLHVIVVIVCDYVSRDVDTLCAHVGLGLWSGQWRPNPLWIPPALSDRFGLA